LASHRWRWYTTTLTSSSFAARPSLEARSDRDVLVEAGQHRLAAFYRRGHDHAIRGDASKFTRLQVGHDHDLPVQQLFGRVGFGDARYNRARLRLADIDFHVDQLVGALDALRRKHLA